MSEQLSAELIAKSRTEFQEAIFAARKHLHHNRRAMFLRNSDGSYSYPGIQDKWEGWIFRHQTICVELRDAERYRKLRRWMSSNVKEVWARVEELGAIAANVCWDEMDASLDELPECNVGLCSVAEIGRAMK